ncbi:MAG TPA: hypothetical protein VGH20_03975 [Myxococcales bacterium]|jgi:hypothetical protein
MRLRHTNFLSSIALGALLFGCGGSQSQPKTNPPPQAQTRTVQGAVTAVVRSDDGSQAVFPIPANTGLNFWQVAAAWVPTATGWDRFPSDTASDGSFVIPGVPQGVYYLELDIPAPDNFGGFPFKRLEAELFPFTADVPDLSQIYPGTQDPTDFTDAATLTVSVDGLAPWNPGSSRVGPGAGDSLILFGSQTGADIVIASGSSLAAGSTSASKVIPWSGTLPNAPKGDVEFVVQRSTSAVGSGATSGTVRLASRFARIADLTLPNGASASRSVTLADAPQTGSMRARILGSQWAPLVQQSNPAAQPALSNYAIMAAPGPVSFPDLSPFRMNLVSVASPASTDVDYGTVAYGQFLGAPWQEVREFDLSANYQFGDSTFALPFYQSIDPMPATADVIPVVGPPLSPRVSGLDAFQNQSGVGLTPLISWSPPSLGAPTSYAAGISSNSATTLYASVSFTVYGATSFRIPPGFLETGVSYAVSVAATQAPWDHAGIPPFRLGVPYASASAVSTASFTP